MTTEEVLEIKPEDFNQTDLDSKNSFKEEVKKALLSALTDLIGKALWWLVPKKWKIIINAVIVYMENH